ncbi:MAG: ATP-binding cassette domain-containing protein [Muribaculaceae bacterium]
MMIRQIILNRVLPSVFELDRAQFASSEVFLQSLRFERGRRYCINARSGRGKTSLCNFIYMSRRDFAGEIHFDDVDVRTLSDRQISRLRRRHLAYLPQELELFDELAALENVQLKMHIAYDAGEPHPDVEEWFMRLGIADRMHQLCGRLSVGQKQRVALIRALSQPFDFLLLDEPVSHLDDESNRLCSKLIAERADQLGAAVVFTSVGNPLMLDGDIASLTL